MQNYKKKKVDRRGNGIQIGIQINSRHERLLKHLQGWPRSDFFNWSSPAPLGTGKSHSSAYLIIREQGGIILP